MKKNSILSIVLLLCSTHTTSPITKNVARALTVGSALASYILVSSFTKNSALRILGIATSSILTSTYAYAVTPEGRLATAVIKTNQLLNNNFSKVSYSEEASFFQDLQDKYTDPFWLISAHDELDALLKVGYRVVELLALVKGEAYDDYTLTEQANILQKNVRCIITNLTISLRRIKNHPDFAAQRVAYNQLLLDKQRLEIERQKAAAHHEQAVAQKAQAIAQQSQADALWHANHTR